MTPKDYRTAATPLMRSLFHNMHKNLLTTAAFLIAFGLGTFLLWQARLWPFSTGTNDKAFLGTTFGMSPAEVQRALHRQNAELLSYDEYRRAEPSPLIDNLGFVPLFSEDRRRNSSLYMPSIQMEASKVEAEFNFRDMQLRSVGVYFDPISHGASQAVVDALERKLRSSFQYLRREDSKEVPGAYTLYFTSSKTAPQLWINLTEPRRPSIMLTVLDVNDSRHQERQLRVRDDSAVEVNH